MSAPDRGSKVVCIRAENRCSECAEGLWRLHYRHQVLDVLDSSLQLDEPRQRQSRSAWS